MLIDSHCHLDCIDLDDFEGDFDTMVRDSRRSGVEHMLCVSINMQSYPAMLEKVRSYKDISVSVGMHPMADKDETFSKQLLLDLAADDKVVAIGETGLDYYYHKGEADWQLSQFRTHVQVANEVDKPLIIHTRDAGEDTLRVLREEGADHCSGVIHCFTETMEFAGQAMDLGFMISFSGIVTFRNADALRDVARMVPDEYLLIETDSPYLAPVPHRGKQNRPAYVRHVAETLAEIRNTSIEHIAEVSRENFYRLFSSARSAV